jgi:hypothetical protein
VLDRLRNNFDLKLLSLAIAVALWAYLRLDAEPAIAARFTQQFSVPLETTGLARRRSLALHEKQAVVAVDRSARRRGRSNRHAARRARTSKAAARASTTCRSK